MPTVPTTPNTTTPSTSVATITAQTPEQAGQSAPGIKFISEPEGAHVYINNLYIGDTPLFYTGYQPGQVKISIQLDGYHPSDRYIDLDPTSYTTVDVQLNPISGFLNLSLSPKGVAAAISVDDLPSKSGMTELPVGQHSLHIEAFGYKDFDAQFDIADNRTTPLAVALAVAPFKLSKLAISRPVLDPANPGVLGTLEISFQASGPGSGSVSIADRTGRLVWTDRLPPFTARLQAVAWNGRDSGGRELPDGAYSVTVEGASGGATDRLAGAVEISHAALIGYRSMLSGVSGLLFVGSPEILPPSSFQIGVISLGHFEAAGELIPIQLSGRFVPASGVELDVQGSLELGSVAVAPYSIGAAAKLRLLGEGASGFSAALSVKGTYLDGTTADTLTNFTGLSVGAPLEYRIGPFGVLVMPEVTVSPFFVSSLGLTADGGTDSDNGALNASLNVWGYGRGGLFLDFGSIVTGVSAALRTEPFAEGLGLDTVPLTGGWEIHWLPPEGNLVLSADVESEYSPSPAAGATTYLLVGAGIGWIF